MRERGEKQNTERVRWHWWDRKKSDWERKNRKGKWIPSCKYLIIEKLWMQVKTRMKEQKRETKIREKAGRKRVISCK